MRVLIACYFHYPLTTGVSNYMSQLAKGLVQKGHQVEIFAEHPDGTKYYLKEADEVIEKEPYRKIAEARVHKGYKEYPYVSSWITEYETNKYAYELAAAQLLDWSKYDVIHAQEIHSARVMSRLKPKHVPLIATLHGCVASETSHQLGYTSVPDNLDGQFITARERYGAMCTDMCIVPSQWLRNVFVENFGVPVDRLHVVHHGMDIESFVQSAQQQSGLRFPKDKKVIFCHARLDPFKGHQYLIEALATLKQRRQDWRCYLAGDGSERARLERRVTELGLSDDITFLGTRTDVPSLLSQADIMVQASLIETWGFTVSEAVIAGKAIVCSDTGGFSEMVRHEETGLLTPIQNSDVLAGNIERLLGDDQLRSQLGTNARAWGLTNLSLHRMTQDTLGVYEHAFQVQKHSIPSDLFLNVIETSRHLRRTRR